MKPSGKPAHLLNILHPRVVKTIGSSEREAGRGRGQSLPYRANSPSPDESSLTELLGIQESGLLGIVKILQSNRAIQPVLFNSFLNNLPSEHRVCELLLVLLPQVPQMLWVYLGERALSSCPSAF